MDMSDKRFKRLRRLLFGGPLATAGFSFIELMVVIVILGILAAYIAPKFMGRTDDAKVTEVKIQIQSFETALKMYKFDNGFYPSTGQGLSALVSQPGSEPSPRKWRQGGYLKKPKIPTDAWGNEYIYASPGMGGPFDIVSRGADGTSGGDGFDKDISNWDVD